MYYDYPLEQGLRQCSCGTSRQILAYYDYPLEQGLRLSENFVEDDSVEGIMIIH